MSEDYKNAQENIEKAERHFKRLRFDCNKYIAAIHAIKLGKFLDSYSPKVISGVNNGQFLIEANQLMRLADESVISAKHLESIGNEQAALEKYTQAVNYYAELENLIKASRMDIQHAQALYGAFEERVEKSNRSGFIVGIAGAIIGVIGIVVGILL